MTSINITSAQAPGGIESLERQFSQLKPFIRHIDDDLPVLDIMVGNSQRPNEFTVSVALYLPDGTLQASSQHQLIEQAMNTALTTLLQKVRLYEKSKRFHRRLLKWGGGQANRS